MPFTSETASEAGKKGALIGNAVIKQRKIAKLLRNSALPIYADSPESYEQKTLVRVRLQLDMVYKAFMDECDKSEPEAGKLDRLAAAQARLSEQERFLSMRPAPGSLKPTSPKSPKTGNFAPPPPADDVQSG